MRLSRGKPSAFVRLHPVGLRRDFGATSSRLFKLILPNKSGCYLMKGASGEILYVGKAKNIKKRVASYWRATDEKTAALVSQIIDIETIVTATEVEALILEMQLIQQYHPKYNIDLQTPGRYAFIKITEDVYPRLVIARKVDKKGRYIGPFPSAAARNAALSVAYRIFRLCKSPVYSRSIGAPSIGSLFAPENGAKRMPPSGARAAKKFRLCFRFHLGLCSGACAGIISPYEYRESIRSAEKFLKGDYKAVIQDTERTMRQAAAEQQFEKAKILRDQLLGLQKIEQQIVSRPKKRDQDVINYVVTGDRMLLQMFHFEKGIISGRKEFSFDIGSLVIGDDSAIVQDFVMQYYAAHPAPHEVIIPVPLPEAEFCREALTRMKGVSVVFTVPKKGLKKKLLGMVAQNLSSRLGVDGGQLSGLQKALRLDAPPQRIACIDISHLGGTNTIGSLVTFANGQPLKSGYRKFLNRDTLGINDVAAIREVVTRFGKRVLEGKEMRPDLLVIDGGRGQLNSAIRALHAIDLEIPAIGLAKRLEEIFLPSVSHSLILHPTNPALQLLQRLRDEAHRFAITFQRKRRSLR